MASTEPVEHPTVNELIQFNDSDGDPAVKGMVAKHLVEDGCEQCARILSSFSNFDIQLYDSAHGTNIRAEIEELCEQVEIDQKVIQQAEAIIRAAQAKKGNS